MKWSEIGREVNGSSEKLEEKGKQCNFLDHSAVHMKGLMSLFLCDGSLWWHNVFRSRYVYQISQNFLSLVFPVRRDKKHVSTERQSDSPPPPFSPNPQPHLTGPISILNFLLIYCLINWTLIIVILLRITSEQTKSIYLLFDYWQLGNS